MNRQIFLSVCLLIVSSAAQSALVTATSKQDISALNVGDTFSIDIRGEGFDPNFDIVGGGFSLSYDSNLLDLIIPPNGWERDTGFWPIGGVLNTTGDYYFTTIFNFPSGDFNIGVMQFKVKNIGTGSVKLAESLEPSFRFVGARSQAYPGEISYGAITVSSVPIPAACWLFGSALGFAAIARKRKFDC